MHQARGYPGPLIRDTLAARYGPRTARRTPAGPGRGHTGPFSAIMGRRPHNMWGPPCMSEHPPMSLSFPIYSRYERQADAVIHVLGVAASLIGSAWLLYAADLKLATSLAIYAAGLVAMLSASALYNLTPPGRRKEILRRVDHAMIFVMIAGSYTPYTIHRLDSQVGIALCVAVWLVAVAGIVLKVGYPRRFDRLGVLLYLAMGWMVVFAIDPLAASVSDTTFTLLFIGGAVYSAGVVFHLVERVPFHNAIWHGCVLVAATLHFTAMSGEFIV